MARILFHIGYHKTASTWLQSRFFASTQGNFQLLGAERRFARRQIVWPSPLEYSPHAVQQTFANALRESQEHGKIPVFSDERYSGNPFSGGFDSVEIAHRIHRTFPDSRILIVIREQRDMILSVYDEYVREGGTASLVDFLNPSTRYVIPSFRFSFFEYNRLCELYIELFGRENVEILLFEQFRSDAESFLSSVLEFSGATCMPLPDANKRVNHSRSAGLLPIQRRMNPFLKSDDLNGRSIFAIPGAKRRGRPLLTWIEKQIPKSMHEKVQARMTAIIRRSVDGIYEESNERLARISALNLNDFGYATKRSASSAGSH